MFYQLPIGKKETVKTPLGCFGPATFTFGWRDSVVVGLPNGGRVGLEPNQRERTWYESHDPLSGGRDLNGRKATLRYDVESSHIEIETHE
ncbi:MAG: hypothetical protein GF368_05155 [Candidatus Aenigmarchaeota archaeon]|nr:hypothetical protein [Candidatus Aenigmarchaeota archaeon]